MKSSDPFFEETQYFRQVWLWVILIATMLFTALVPWVFSDIDEPVYVKVLTSFIPVFVLSWFYILRLDTRITEDGIFFRFFPLHRRFRQIKWEEIERLDVLKYHPIRDFGGWGIKYGVRGRAYNVSGNIGLMIYKKDGSRLLIGTNKADSLKDVVMRLNLK